MKDRSIKILIISDAVTNLSYSSDKIDNIDYNIQIQYCKKDLSDIDTKCDDEFDIIISETYDFAALKQKHNCPSGNQNVCKNFFGFSGRFVLLNAPIDESKVRNYDTAFFPNCKTFKRKKYTETTQWEALKKLSFNALFHPNLEVKNDNNFLAFLKKEVKKYVAVEKDFIFSGVLFWRYLLSLERSYRILIQLILLFSISFLFIVNNDFTISIKRFLTELSSYFGSHLFNPNISAIRPMSIIITIITCYIYWRWYVRDLQSDINKDISLRGFKILYWSSPIIFITILLLLLKLFESSFKFQDRTIYSYDTEYFFFKDYFIIFLLTLLDIVILFASREASKSHVITKYTQTKLINIYDLSFQTLFFCDIPILIGTFILSYQEQFITYSEPRTAYQIGATASSLFILQLIYFFINLKSSYEDYLSS